MSFWNHFHFSTLRSARLRISKGSAHGKRIVYSNNNKNVAFHFSIWYTICLPSPSILVPRLHLRIAEPELVGQLHSILNAQVLLTFKRLLQRLQLMIGKRSACFALLFAQTARTARQTAQATLHAAAAVIIFGTFSRRQKKTTKHLKHQKTNSQPNKPQFFRMTYTFCSQKFSAFNASILLTSLGTESNSTLSCECRQCKWDSNQSYKHCVTLHDHFANTTPRTYKKYTPNKGDELDVLTYCAPFHWKTFFEYVVLFILCTS